MDRMLFERIKREDPYAFEELLASCEKLIVKTCRHFMRNEEDTEDAVIESEAMLCKWLSKSTYNRSFEEEDFLVKIAYTITRNVCENMLNHMRTKKRGKDITISLDGMRGGKDDDLVYDPPDPTQDVEKEVIRREEAECLRECMRSLPEKQYDALLLTQIQGYSYSEAAGILKVKEGTAKNLVFRAKEKLKEILKKWDFGLEQIPAEPADIIDITSMERRNRK